MQQTEINRLAIVGTSYWSRFFCRSLWNENQFLNLVNVFYKLVHVHCLEWDKVSRYQSSCPVISHAHKQIQLFVYFQIARVIGNHCREPHQRSCPDVPLGIYVANKIISIVKNRPQLAVAIMEQFKKDYLKERNEYLNQH